MYYMLEFLSRCRSQSLSCSLVINRMLDLRSTRSVYLGVERGGAGGLHRLHPQEAPHPEHGVVVYHGTTVIAIGHGVHLLPPPGHERLHPDPTLCP